MQFQKKDIWTRRERDKRVVVWISEGFLVESIKGLTEYKLRTKHRYNYLNTVTGERRRKQAVLPDTGASWRYARKRNVFYYDYDRLPDNRKRQLPPKEELLARYEKAMKSNVQSSMESDLLEYLKDLSPWLKAYAGCTDLQAEHLARACAVIQFAAREISAMEPTSSNDYYRNLSSVIKRRGWVYLPKNYRRLKEKIMRVVKGKKVTKVIKLPRKNNNNRQPYSDEQVIGWMMYLRSRPENYSNAHIARRILKMCQIARKESPSESWITHYFSRPRSKWLTGAARHRSGRKGADYRDYLPIAGALYAGDCWQMDGTRINFIPHSSSDGKERSMIIVAVRDVHSGDLIGFHFDTKEDRYAYIHALNMAVVYTGHLPYELVHDRFPGHNTDEWTLLTRRMEREGVKVTVTSTATSKSHLERCFSTLQDVFMQDFKWFYGQGVQSSREAAHRSPEYLASAKKAARREGFDFDMAWRAAAAVVNNYRTTPLCEYSRKNSTVKESPKELYMMSETPNVHPIDDCCRIELFGTMRSETIRNNGLIRMRIHKADYVYRIEDYEIIANYKKVNVYYDLDDLSKVYLFAPGDDVNSLFLGEAIEEQAVQYYGPDADFERMSKMKAARRQIRERRKEELEAVIAGTGDEVDLLMAAHIDKTTTDDAQTRWLEDRAAVWVDRGEERRIEKPAGRRPRIEDDDEDIDLQVIRNY
jgi:hypothetical protein